MFWNNAYDKELHLISGYILHRLLTPKEDRHETHLSNTMGKDLHLTHFLKKMS